jgi:hypothetical protein
MSDNLDKLFKVARAMKRDTSRVEFGFETRLLARLHTERAQAAPWFAFAWKLVPAFAAIAVALGVWNFTGATAVDLPTAIVGNTEDTVLVSYLTGDSQ